jgi:hypothetical protein
VIKLDLEPVAVPRYRPLLAWPVGIGGASED